MSRKQKNSLAGVLISGIFMVLLVCGLRVRADDPPLVSDVTVTAAAPSASPAIIEVNRAATITVSGTASAPSPTDAEASIGSPSWTFSFVNAKVVSTKPAEDFDWSTVTDAPTSSYTQNLSSSTVDTSSTTFNFTPKVAGYWHITVSAAVAYPETRGRSVLRYHTGWATSPNVGLTLTAVSLDLIWQGDNTQDSDHGSVSAGASIKGKSIYLVVGQKVSISAKTLPSDASLGSPTWTVGGMGTTAITGFTTTVEPNYWHPQPTVMPSPCSGQMQLLTRNDLTTLSPTVFYWSGPPGNQPVSIAIAIAGLNATANATFIVQTPIIDDPTNPTCGYWATPLGLTSLGESASNHCVILNLQCMGAMASNWTEPNPNPGPGKIAWVQIVVSANRGIHYPPCSAMSAHWDYYTPTDGLDTCYPIDDWGVTLWKDYPAQQVDCPCPADQSPPDQRTWSDAGFVHDTFRTYILYKCGGTGIGVPVYSFMWEWGGQASLNDGSNRHRAASWTLTGAFQDTMGQAANYGWYAWTRNIKPNVTWLEYWD